MSSLHAAATKVDISPKSPQWLMGYQPRQSTGVRDPIYHRVLVLKSGDDELILVSSELCLFSPELYEEVKARLVNTRGINPDSLWWSATHTHSAPEVGPRGLYECLLGRSAHDWDRDYTESVVESFVRQVSYTRRIVVPARLRVGSTQSRANISRRSLNVDGAITLGLNPDAPVDHQVGVLRVEKVTGEPIAVAVNYPIHGTVLNGYSTVVSGDAPGIVMNYLEYRLQTQVLFLNGAAGDVAPIYSSYPDAESAQMSQFNVLLGNRVLDALADLGEPVDQVGISTSRITVATPARPDLAWPEALSAYRHGGDVLLPVHVARVGEIGFWAAPVELFSEIGMAVRAVSPYPHTFFCGYTNGWFGYLPTARAFAEGGYEPQTSPFTAAAEGDLLREVPAALRRLR